MGGLASVQTQAENTELWALATAALAEGQVWHALTEAASEYDQGDTAVPAPPGTPRGWTNIDECPFVFSAWPDGAGAGNDGAKSDAESDAASRLGDAHGCCGTLRAGSAPDLKRGTNKDWVGDWAVRPCSAYLPYECEYTATLDGGGELDADGDGVADKCDPCPSDPDVACGWLAAAESGLDHKPSGHPARPVLVLAGVVGLLAFAASPPARKA